MFAQKEEGFSGATVIAEGVRVEGNFKGDGPMIIDGIVKGTIATTKAVEVGKSASIEANIKADTVVVGGHVKGNIAAKSRVELLAGSNVEGDIATKTLVVAEGASLNGKCSTGTTAAAETIQRSSAPDAEENEETGKQAATKSKGVARVRS